MEPHMHDITALFDQLGLDSSDQAIDEFINKNSPLPMHVELHKAGFWNASQASFLKQVKDEDADWVDIVEQLNVMLRPPVIQK